MSPPPPTVTVGIPAYQAERFLAETIRSVAAQTFADWELLINDDASTDGTWAVAQRTVAALANPRIHLTRNPHRLGMAENWNATLRPARGKFLKLLCGDDRLAPDALARQVGALREHPSASLATGAREIIDASGRVLFTRSGLSRGGLLPGRATIRRCLLAGTNLIGDPVVVLWRRSALATAAPFDPAIHYCTDLDCWLRLLGAGDLVYDRKPVGQYRVHGRATGPRLRKIVVEDFLRVADVQQRLGTVRLSAFDRRVIACKSGVLAVLRSWLYRCVPH